MGKQVAAVDPRFRAHAGSIERVATPPSNGQIATRFHPRDRSTNTRHTAQNRAGLRIMGSRVVMFPARSARGAGNPYIEQSNHLKPHRRMAESGPHPTIEWSNRRYELWHPPSQGRITRVDPPAGGSNVTSRSPPPDGRMHCRRLRSIVTGCPDLAATHRRTVKSICLRRRYTMSQ